MTTKNVHTQDWLQVGTTAESHTVITGSLDPGAWLTVVLLLLLREFCDERSLSTTQSSPPNDMLSEMDTQKHRNKAIPSARFVSPRLRLCVPKLSSRYSVSDLFLFLKVNTFVLKLITSEKQQVLKSLFIFSIVMSIVKVNCLQGTSSRIFLSYL